MCLITTIGLVAITYRPNVLVLTPGPADDVSGDFLIVGHPVTPINGRYLKTSVRVHQPTLLGLGLASLRSDREIVRPSEPFTERSDPVEEVVRDAKDREQSLRLAALAAAQAVGMPASIAGTGALVDRILAGSPADGVLRRGDTVVAVDGQRVRLVSDLPSAMRSRPAGGAVRLTIERHGATFGWRVTPRRLDGRGEPLIGAAFKTRDLDIRLPFRVRFRTKVDAVGPSAGLAYALAIADALDRRDLARGRIIAATGTLDEVGSVGPIGGPDLKARAALRAGASLFLIPADQRADTTGVTTEGVNSLADAIERIS